MSFLKNLFKTKENGSFLGNLIRGATSVIPVVGPAISGGLQQAYDAKVATMKAADAAAQATTFAGQPATVGTDGLITLSNQLQAVSVPPPVAASSIAAVEPQKQSIIDNIQATASWKGSGGRDNYLSFGTQTQQVSNNNNMLMLGGLGLAALLLLKGRR